MECVVILCIAALCCSGNKEERQPVRRDEQEAVRREIRGEWRELRDEQAALVDELRGQLQPVMGVPVVLGTPDGAGISDPALDALVARAMRRREEEEAGGSGAQRPCSPEGDRR